VLQPAMNSKKIKPKTNVHEANWPETLHEKSDRFMTLDIYVC